MGREGLSVLLAVGVAAGCGTTVPKADLPPEWQEQVAGIDFVLIQPGRFRMGLLADSGALRPAPPHEVEITRPFYLGKFEVSQAEWFAVTGTHPSQHPDCPACPVESISWHDAQRFLKKLEEGNPGESFRLPTEAEWEYACRAGGSGRYGGTLDTLGPTGANVDGRIPFEGRSSDGFLGHPTAVGSSGNVWEWVEDRYCPYPAGPVADPFGTCVTDTVPIRGGSWYFSAGSARCGRRYTHHVEDSGFSLGLRVVREVLDEAFQPSTVAMLGSG
jgi:formylglycine-generating enzyme required for sulfatase activity